MLCKQVVFLLLSCFFFKTAYTYFTAVGPRSVEYDGYYKLFLTTSHGYDDIFFDISLKSKSGKQIDKRSEFLMNNESKSISLELNNKIQNYVLTVSSESFHQSVDIQAFPKKINVLIQTEKSIYKPGDKVQFRVLLLDSEMKPYTYDYMYIRIINPKSKRISLPIDDSNEEDFTLELDHVINNDVAESGLWTIEVEVDDVTTSHHFEVEEYQLPRLEVFADTREYVPISDKEIVVKIYAKDLSGEFARGKTTVTVDSYDPKTFESLNKKKVYKMDISEPKNLILNMNDDLKVYMITLRDIKVNITVEFEEQNTREKVILDKTVTIHNEGNFNIKVFRKSPMLIPGFPYEITFAVYKPDGTLEDYAGILKMKAEYYYEEKCGLGNEDEENTNFELHALETLKDGMVKHVIDVPSNTTGIEFLVNYYHNEFKTTVYVPVSVTNVFFKASLKPGSELNIGQNLIFQVESSSHIETINYIVIGRNGRSISKSAHPNARNFDLSFTTQAWMVPGVKVLVYYIHSTGEVMRDILEISPNESLPDDLTITLSSNTTHSGDSIDLTIKSKPNSFVFLRAINYGVELLKARNNVNKKSEFEDFKDYSVYENLDKLKYSGTYGNSKFYHDVGPSNAFIITDAYKGELQCESKRNKRSIDQHTSRIASRPSDTWIFKSFKVDGEGRYELSEMAPSSGGTWIISAFAVSSEHGLSIAKPQTLNVREFA